MCVGAERGGVGGREPEIRGRPGRRPPSPWGQEPQTAGRSVMSHPYCMVGHIYTI